MAVSYGSKKTNLHDKKDNPQSTTHSSPLLSLTTSPDEG